MQKPDKPPLTLSGFLRKSRIAPAVWCGSGIPTLLICSAPCLRKCDLLHFSGLHSSPLAAPVASVPSGTFQPSHRNLMPFLACLHQLHDFTPSCRRPPVKAFCLEFLRYAVMYHPYPLRTEYHHRKGHRLPLVADYPVCLWFCVCSTPETCRTGTDYAVCNNLITLPRFPVLSGPLADLHRAGYAGNVAF